MALPSNEEQLSLELINRARIDPAGEYDRLILDKATRTATDPDVTSAIRFFNVDLDLLEAQFATMVEAPPLAWNAQLADAAQGHSDLMKVMDEQSHQLSGEPDLGRRADNAGYDWNRIGENVYAYSDTIFYGHAGFMIDWGYGAGGIQDGAGHRVNMMRASYVEAGIGVTFDTNAATDVGPNIITQNFGSSFGYAPQFVGVVIDDADGDLFYDIGEGLGGVTVTLAGSGGTWSTTSWASGGWQIAVPAGDYTITFSGGGLPAEIVKNASLGGQNVKVDAIAGDVVASGPTEGSDTLIGTDGDDDMTGLGGPDMLVGGAGNDTLDGGANPEDGGDMTFGGAGDDTYLVDSGLDLVDEGNAYPEYGGGGVNTIISTADFFWDVFSAAQLLRVSEDVADAGGDGVTIIGGVFDDTLAGHSGTDILFGRGGSDTYLAGDGIDFISLSTLGLDDANAYAGVDGVNTVIVEQRASGATSYDIVFEFETGKDRIDVSDYAEANALTTGADVLARAVDDGAGSSYIALGDGFDYVYLVGLEVAELNAGDFLIA